MSHRIASFSLSTITVVEQVWHKTFFWQIASAPNPSKSYVDLYCIYIVFLHIKYASEVLQVISADPEWTDRLSLRTWSDCSGRFTSFQVYPIKFWVSVYLFVLVASAVFSHVIQWCNIDPELDGSRVRNPLIWCWCPLPLARWISLVEVWV